MLSIPLTQTQDNYVQATTFGNSGTPYANGYITVTGASVFATVYHGHYGQPQPLPEVEWPPGTFPFQEGYRDPIQGVALRSAVAGVPAMVKGALFEQAKAVFQGG